MHNFEVWFLELLYALLFFFAAFYFLLVLFFWAFNIFFIFLELTGNPEAILQYRIQPKQKPPIVRFAWMCEYYHSPLHHCCCGWHIVARLLFIQEYVATSWCNENSQAWVLHCEARWSWAFREAFSFVFKLLRSMCLSVFGHAFLKTGQLEI